MKNISKGETMIKSTYLVMALIVGIFIGILTTTLITLANNSAYADATGGESSGIIAVTGLCANGLSGLWVLDARDTKYSPSLCLYMPDNGGRSGFKLTGARRIKYDLALLQYQDNSPKDYSPTTLQRDIEALNKKAEEKNAKNK